MAQPPLDPNEMLKAEFEYIAQTATQANEDRAKVTSFYFVTVGTLLAAILGTQFLSQEGESLKGVFLGFSLLFIFLTLLGYLTIAQLARLRTAWIDSAKAMNQIKEYYVQQVEDDLVNAFRWTKDTMPKAYKKGSVANYLAGQVAILSGLIFGAAVYFFQLGIDYTSCLIEFAISLGVFMCILQLYLYKRILTK